VQIELIDVLADAGASLAGHPDNALVNGNIAPRSTSCAGRSLDIGDGALPRTLAGCSAFGGETRPVRNGSSLWFLPR
jgi:hypothetical protein